MQEVGVVADCNMSELDSVSQAILSLISLLDNVGAERWNLNLVAVATTATILVIKKRLGQLHGVDWYAFMHAVLTGVGSCLCLYLDIFAYDFLRQVRWIPGQCGDLPLTSLHRILPAITMGYSIFDMLDSFHLRLDFLLHGGATFLVMALFVENDVPHLVNSMLLMENSSIFLNLVRAKHLTPFWSTVNQLMFMSTFFFFRLILAPYLWVRDVSMLLSQELTDDYCLPYYFSKVVLCLGPFFHLLNAYWFYKIIQKAKRKLSGKEKLDENNDLTESEHQTNGANGKKHV